MGEPQLAVAATVREMGGAGGTAEDFSFGALGDHVILRKTPLCRWLYRVMGGRGPDMDEKLDRNVHTRATA